MNKNKLYEMKSKNIGLLQLTISLTNLVLISLRIVYFLFFHLTLYLFVLLLYNLIFFIIIKLLSYSSMLDLGTRPFPT